MDGFRFDLAACLCRDVHGEPLEAPPVIREISKDPVLSKVSDDRHAHHAVPAGEPLAGCVGCLLCHAAALLMLRSNALCSTPPAACAGEAAGRAVGLWGPVPGGQLPQLGRVGRVERPLPRRCQVGMHAVKSATECSSEWLACSQPGQAAPAASTAVGASSDVLEKSRRELALAAWLLFCSALPCLQLRICVCGWLMGSAYLGGCSTLMKYVPTDF